MQKPVLNGHTFTRTLSTILALLFFNFSFAQTGVVNSSGFETSNILKEWDSDNGCCSYSITKSTSIKKAGTASARFELNKTDPISPVGGSKRAELSYNVADNLSQLAANLRWFKFSTYMPTGGWNPDPAGDIFVQWHDKSPSCSTSPPLSFNTINNKIQVTIRYIVKSPYCSNTGSVGRVSYDLDVLEYDKWNNWTVYYNPSYTSTGEVIIYKNGVVKFRYNGPCDFNGTWPHYWKFGIYKWVWAGSSSSTATKRIIHFDDVMVGTSSASLSSFEPSAATGTLASGANINISTSATSATIGMYESSSFDGKYAWKQISGPATATIASAASKTTAVSNLSAQGSYVFRQTITEGSNSMYTTYVVTKGTASSTANNAPVANAGSAINITLPTSSASLKGTSSTDADGSITSYKWAQVSGPSTATLANTTTATATASKLVAGTYSFKLTVTDNDGATDDATVVVTVADALSTANKLPVANAGANKTITLPTSSATLSGAASTDADGTIASYKWTQSSGPSTSTITNSTTVGPTVSKLVQGTYVYKLTITDNRGGTATATTSVIVNAAGATNKAPVANAGTTKVASLPTTSTTLIGSGSSDPDGSIASYSWAQVSGPGTAYMPNGNKTADLIIQRLVKGGNYNFRLTVTDNKGATATATVIALVNDRPIAKAGADKTVTLPATSTTLSGSASYDPDGSLKTYQWSQISGPKTSTLSSTTTAGTTVSSLATGTFSYQLTVTDNYDVVGRDTIKVTVRAATSTSMPNQAPIGDAGPDQSISLPENTVTLNGAASADEDGSIKTYAWTMLQGPNAPQIVNADAQTATVTDLAEGEYTFQLVVTDDMGASDTSAVAVAVQPIPANQLPVAEIATVYDSANNVLYLNGSNSTDADGSIAMYQWKIANGATDVAIADPNTAETKIEGLAPGTYVLQLTVKDNQEAVHFTQTTITISAATSAAVVKSSRSNMRVYPNPVHDLTTVRLDDNKTGKAVLKVYTMSGVVVYQESIEKTSVNFSKQLNLSALVPGSYLISVQFEKSKETVRKIQKL